MYGVKSGNVFDLRRHDCGFFLIEHFAASLSLFLSLSLILPVCLSVSVCLSVIYHEMIFNYTSGKSCNILCGSGHWCPC